jgi:hypothetical protein
MTEIPDPQHTIANLIDQHHESNQSKPRPHLGASIAGHHCDRWIWLSFRWAVIEKFPGRILRLFRRGHLEEAQIVKDLEAIGVTVTDDQKRVTLGGHVSGSIDGIADGVPGAWQTAHLVEMKTHALKSFKDLAANGVEASKPQHYAQMQLYMHGLGLTRALYFAVCKDNDEIYTERVRYDEKAATAMMERAERISLADRIPDPISTDPSWYLCKWCPAHAFCHKAEPTHHVNCRTCAHATAKPDGTWRCERHEADGIPEDFQRRGCDDHVLHPDLVPWPIKDSGDPHEAVYVIDGVDVRNGHPDAHVFASSELIANPKGCVDNLARAVRKAFLGAKVTG